VFLDCDCLPRRDWLREIAMAFDDPPLTACGGLMLSAPAQTFTEAFTARTGILNQEDFMRSVPGRPAFLLSANFAIRRSVFDRLGGFDSSIEMGEDADLCWRIARDGGKFLLARNAIVEHRHRATIRTFARRMVIYGKGSVDLYARYKNDLGPNARVDVEAWKRLARAILKTLISPFRRGSWQRREAAVDVVRWTAYLYGRIVGARKYGVVAF